MIEAVLNSQTQATPEKPAEAQRAPEETGFSFSAAMAALEGRAAQSLESFGATPDAKTPGATPQDGGTQAPAAAAKPDRQTIASEKQTELPAKTTQNTSAPSAETSREADTPECRRPCRAVARSAGSELGGRQCGSVKSCERQ